MTVQKFSGCELPPSTNVLPPCCRYRAEALVDVTVTGDDVVPRLQLALHPAVEPRVKPEAEGLGLVIGEELYGGVGRQADAGLQAGALGRYARSSAARAQGDEPQPAVPLQRARVVIAH